LVSKFANDIQILDVGCGSGGYFELLNGSYNNIDGIEIYPNYIQMFNLDTKYRRLILGDVLHQDLSGWEYFIMGDVIEHMTYEEALQLIQKIHNSGKFMMVAVPYLFNQDEEYGNIHEIHKQPDLTKEVFLERYPCMKFLFGDNNYGYFVNYD
jgi:cyclopropane fatty-acyl-phospholipid synthase-like methyltransferase